MKKTSFLLSLLLLTGATCLPPQLNAQLPAKKIVLSAKAGQVLAGKQILYIERAQYAPDHHNTATLFQPGEINEKSFEPGGAMRVFDVDTREVRTLIELKEGVVRDPEVSYDGKKIVFSMRKSPQDSYHIYEINADGSGLRQLTCATGVSDIDPVYLPAGKSSSPPPGSPNTACATATSWATCTA